jgi:hypothetical protein
LAQSDHLGEAPDPNYNERVAENSNRRQSILDGSHDRATQDEADRISVENLRKAGFFAEAAIIQAGRDAYSARLIDQQRHDDIVSRLQNISDQLSEQNSQLQTISAKIP